ncbi:MAG: aquaporin [Pseudomonadota bacterium]
MTRPLLAEFLGTFMLVFAGTGAIIINDVSGGAITHLGVAITFGLIVLAVIYTYGDVSGAHINPAVTIAFWAAGRFPAHRVLPYLAAQCAGGIIASLALKLLFPDHPTLGATLPNGAAMQSFVLELILSWWLMTVILAVAHGAKEKGLVAGIVIGAVVLLEALFAGPICGASMNPARSLAPALLSGNLADLWIYLSAPVLGMLLAVWSCRYVNSKDCCASGRCRG